MNNSKSKQFVLCGLGMAIVFILTCFISVPIGQFGYVNRGDSAVMLFSIVLILSSIYASFIYVLYNNNHTLLTNFLLNLLLIKFIQTCIKKPY